MEYEFSHIPPNQPSKSLGIESRFSLSSAYGQLILLVFVPITILALVGAALVLSETARAAKAEQRAYAQAIFARYEPVVKKLAGIMDTVEGQQKAQQILQSMLAEQHLNRAGVVDNAGRERIHIGPGRQQGWPAFAKNRQAVHDLPTSGGDVYGIWAGVAADSPVWLLVEIDNQPFRLAQLKVWLALVATGLATILLLLLCLNIYSRRWIAPVYEMRLHLQQTNADNLYRPMNVATSGEINLLQRDIVYLLRRLHVSFAELKEYSEQTEDDLRQAFDEMELQTISVRSARDAAVRANEAKSAFLANISHELRTPLNSIDGFINLLARKGSLSGEQKTYVQTIKKSSAHLLALVNDVLDFSKIEAGKLVLDEQEVDFYAAIYDVVDMLTPQAADKDLDVAVFYYPDVPTHIVSDELRCKQVLTNLVSNALKFTEQGEVLVRASLEDDALPNGRKLGKKDKHILVVVQDTGAGVAKADRKHLFKSFSQGDPSVTRQYGGTGLGLVISKQLVRLMGGDIGYLDNSDSNIAAQGSTFWFSVPARRVVADMPSEEISRDYQVLGWLEHEASLQVLTGLLASMGAHFTKADSMLDMLNRLKTANDANTAFDWLVVDGEGDVTNLLANIREVYAGKVAAFGYQVSLDFACLERFDALGLYQPINRRSLVGLFEETLGNEHPEHMQWQGAQVLAVDDHLPNLMVLEALLGEFGVVVTTASSGFEAIEAVKARRATAKPFDMVFMDIQMPRMSGFEAAAGLRKLEAEADQPASYTPIIALTAHSLADERDKVLASGIDDYVGKPINQVQLLQILKKWLVSEDASTPLKLTALPQALGTQAEQVVFDWADALNRSAGKPDLAKDILNLLLKSIPDERAALQAAWDADDVSELHQIAHRLAGGARYTGAIALRSSTQTLQQQSLSLLDESEPEARAKEVLHEAYGSVLAALSQLENFDFSGIAT